jgi:hypothetical protein
MAIWDFLAVGSDEHFLKCGSVDGLPNPSYADESNPIKRSRGGQILANTGHDLYSANKPVVPNERYR